MVGTEAFREATKPQGWHSGAGSGAQMVALQAPGSSAMTARAPEAAGSSLAVLTPQPRLGHLHSDSQKTEFTRPPGPSSAPTGLRVAVQSLALASRVPTRGGAAPCPRVRGGRCPQGLAVGPAVCVCVAAVSGVTSAVYGVARSAASAAVLHALCFHSLKVGASSWGLR